MTVNAQQPTVAPRTGLILGVLGTCFLIVMMDNTILNVALQTVQEDLSASNSELQWSVDAFILVYAALMFSAGVLADQHGRRRVLLLGLGVFAGASALSAFAQTPEQLILWRAVMGIGGAVIPPTTLAIIKDVFPPEQHGKAMGLWAALGGMSVAFGPIIGGILLESFWWGSVFLINVPIVLVCAVLILRAVPESSGDRRRKLDVGGVVLSMLGTALLVYGVIHGGSANDWLRVDTLGAIVAGLLLMAALIAYERRQQAPALDVTLFRSAPFAAGTVSVAVSFFALTGGTFLIVFYVQLVRNHSPLELGLILLPVAVGSVAAAVAAAGIAARRGARAVIVTGLALLCISMLGLAPMSATTPLWILEFVLLAAGLGMGLVMATTTTLVMQAVAAEKSGVGAAVNNTLRQVGAALGVAVMGSVYSVRYRGEFEAGQNALPASLPDAAHESLSSTLLALGHAPDPVLLSRAQDAFVASMQTTVLVAAGVLAVGIALGWLWLPKHVQAPAAPTAADPRPSSTEGEVLRGDVREPVEAGRH